MGGSVYIKSEDRKFLHHKFPSLKKKKGVSSGNTYQRLSGHQHSLGHNIWSILANCEIFLILIQLLNSCCFFSERCQPAPSILQPVQVSSLTLPCSSLPCTSASFPYYVCPLCMWGVTLHEMARRLLFMKRLSCNGIWTTHFKKWGYFIIASALSKTREHIQIPCNSNHLFAEPSILSSGGLGSVRECSVPNCPPGLKAHLGPSALTWEALAREVVGRWCPVQKEMLPDFGEGLSCKLRFLGIYSSTGQVQGLVWVR